MDARHYFDFTVSHEQHLIDKQIDEDGLHRLNEAIKKLSLRKKEVIYYFFYEELDYGQIQEIMGLESLKSARNLLYKALNFLREVMG
jgi:DNA-directed RNA polymerase specialized sigma24 family protein